MGYHMESRSKKLEEIDIDVSGVVNRLGGNESLYLIICSKFTKDTNYLILKEALSKKDYQSAEIRIHTLKGIAANLGFIRLEIISRSVLYDIRERELVNLRHDIYSLTEEYKRIISALTEDQQVFSN